MSNKNNSIKEYINEEKLSKISTLYLHYFNLESFINLENNLNNLEMLSLQNNNIQNFDFIKFLPNLWYFDIRNNPISNYDPLVTKNIFGFLGLHNNKYLEKSLLQVKRLIVGTLFVDLDENYKKNFLSNNPNILVYNDELVLEIDKNIKREFISKDSISSKL
jgi:hypothetical protein